jgi:hypothetical protein
MQENNTQNKLFDVARKLLLNSDFTDLHNRLNSFNVFNAFGHNEKEPRHTELLRYLLDPHETHGIGDAFLRNMLLHLCNDSKLLADELFMLNIGATDVSSQNSRNKRRIDIKVEIPYQSLNKDPLLILLEMKIRAQEGIDQLLNYSNDYEEMKNKILVYLTIRDEESVADDWLNITYDSLIIPAVKSTIKAFEDKLDPEIIGLLKNYQEVLESFTVKDSDRADIVEKILKEIDTKEIMWDAIEKLPIMRPYWRAIAELKKRSLIIEKRPMLKQFNKWCAERNHEPYSSNETYMRFLPSYLGGDTKFTSANSDIAGFVEPGKYWTQKPAAMLFEIYRVRNSDDGSQLVGCQIMLGPIKEEIDRDFYRTKLRTIMGTKGRAGNVYSKIGEIGSPETFENKLESINTWLQKQENEAKLSQIKALMLTKQEGDELL